MNLWVARQPACVYLGTPAPEKGTVQWRSRSHGRGCRHWHLTARHVTDDPMATTWPHPLPRGSCQSRIAGARNQGQSRCRIAKPETSHNAEPQTRDSHDAGSQDPGPPHAGQPRIHMSFGRTRPQPINRLSLSRAGCPTAPEPGAAATPGGRSSRLRTW